MRKLVFLLAAGLLVAAPLVAVVPTDVFAAKAKTKVAPPDPNTAFLRALSDLGAQLAQPRVVETARHRTRAKTAAKQ